MAKSATSAITKPQSRSGKKDNFALYIALLAVVLLALLLAFYFYLHTRPSYDPKETYLPLPQMTYESDGQVAQLQVIVQVSEKDQDWMQKNNDMINEIFKKTMRDIEPASLRTQEGSAAALVKLKNAINGELKVDKVQAVLYKDVILQYKVE